MPTAVYICAFCKSSFLLPIHNKAWLATYVIAALLRTYGGMLGDKLGAPPGSKGHPQILLFFGDRDDTPLLRYANVKSTDKATKRRWQLITGNLHLMGTSKY